MLNDTVNYFHVFLHISDNMIQVHDLKSINFVLVHQVVKAKGANLFSLDIQVRLVQFEAEIFYKEF